MVRLLPKIYKKGESLYIAKSMLKLDQDIYKEEPLPNYYIPNINDFERIKVLGGRNCAFRAMLKSTD